MSRQPNAIFSTRGISRKLYLELEPGEQLPSLNVIRQGIEVLIDMGLVDLEGELETPTSEEPPAFSIDYVSISGHWKSLSTEDRQVVLDGEFPLLERLKKHLQEQVKIWEDLKKIVATEIEIKELS